MLRRQGPSSQLTRDPRAMRALILREGFAEIYLRGYQGASIDRIIDRVGATKGAFFHHFPHKLDLGYSIVDDVIRPMIEAQWVIPLRDSRDPLTTIALEFERGARELAKAPVSLGCPLNNLAQEMSPIDDGFRDRTNAVFVLWMRCFERALRSGQRSGVVSARTPARETAFALVAQIEGILSLSKNGNPRNALRTGARSLRRYLDTLRP
jgi:TetR/AcrR family transcriptional repressor of nem operon